MADNCSVEGCDRRTYARGLCEPHYRRRQRTGDVNADRAIGDVAVYPCLVESCRRLATERGLCHAHYLRLLRTGVVGADYARQLCRNHCRRLLRTGDPRATVPIGERRRNGHLNQPSGQRLVDKIEWAVALLSVYAPDRLRSHRLTGESQLCGVPPTGFEPVLPP